MKRVLILGAGLIARPIIRYLLDQPSYHVTVATRTVSKAEELIKGHPRGEAKSLLVSDETALEDAVSRTDLVVSLLPYVHHVTVARYCIKHRKHLVTTSYVSDAMRSLDEDAKDAGVVFLNEIGLDPGIDHMEAMRIIHRVKNAGGRVTSFRSYCGGLPAPEANNNPFGYKFSWSPRGVLMAGKNSARFLEDGKEKFIPGEQLFDNYTILDVDGLGKFENYPNRNSLPYINTYGIETTRTMYRGTLRNLGWCTTMRKIAEAGLLDEKDMKNLRGLTYRQFVRKLLGVKSGHTRLALAKKLGIARDSEVMKRFEWLGLLSNEKIAVDSSSPLDILVARMWEKMQYCEGERDMIILRHDFVVEYPAENREEEIRSTLIVFGTPGGDTAMSVTVGLPAAIGVKLILEGNFKQEGVCIPVTPDIYEPVMKELRQYGVAFEEKVMR